jgi:hypothetical protein
MDRDLSDRIRERAYEIWMANGCRHGESERHWFAAEQEIMAGSLLQVAAADAPIKAKGRGNGKRSKASLSH